MPHHETRTVKGTIGHIFHHRFVVETDDGAVLADVTPKGLDRIKLKSGDRVELFGEMKPSELKVSRFTRGSETVEIEHKPKHEHDHAPADPKVAIEAAKQAGFDPLGDPRRKPKHFEVLGRRGGELTELHIELDGHIRKSKPADRHDPKWAEALSA
jgi:translation initiation factor IF-1